MRFITFAILLSALPFCANSQDCVKGRFMELRKIGVKNMTEEQYAEYALLREACMETDGNDLAANPGDVSYSRSHKIEMEVGFFANQYKIDEISCEKSNVDDLLYTFPAAKNMAIASKIFGVTSKICLVTGLLTTSISIFANMQKAPDEKNSTGLVLGLSLSGSALIFLITDMSLYSGAIDRYNNADK